MQTTITSTSMPATQRKIKSRKLAATAAFVIVGTVAFVLLAVLGGTQANAATITWGNVGTNFATGANWLGGTAPANNTTTDIGAFTNGTVTNNPVFTANRSINGLQFNSGTAAWTFTGSGGPHTLTLGSGGITNNSANTQTFSASGLQLALGSNLAFAATSGALAINSAVNLGAQTLTLSGASAGSTISGQISGTGGLIKTGANTWTLTASNTYTGATTISNGTLQIGNGGTTGRLNPTSNVSIASGATLAVNRSDRILANTDISPNLSGAGTVVMLGTGTLSLRGNNSGLTGGVRVEQGTLDFGNSQLNLGTGTLTLGVNGGTGAVRAWVNDDGIQAFSNAIVLASGHTGSLTIEMTGENNFPGTPGSSKTFTGGITGTNNLTISNNSGVENLNFNTGAINHTGTITFGGTATTGLTTINAAIGSNVTSLTQNGTSILVLTASNTYTGTTTLNAGTLRVGNNGALSTNTFTINGGVFASDSATARTITNAITMGGNVQLGDATGTGALTLSNIDLGTAARTFTVSNNTTVAGVISNTGGLTKAGAGTMTLAGVNTYSGTTTIGAGVLAVTNGSAIADTGVVTLSNNAGATLTVRSSETIGSLRGGGTTGGNVSIASGQTLTVAETGSQTFAGAITNAGGLTKTGTGTLTLSGSNTFTGATVVSAGNLVLSNTGGAALGNTTNITVNSGATLTLGANNQIGDSTGLTLNGGTFVVGTSSAGYSDSLGTLTLNANSVIDLGSFTGLHSLTFANSSGIAWATNATLTISNWQGTIWSPGTAGSVLFGVGGLTSAQLSQVRWAPQGLSGAGLINSNGELTPIPEPRVYAAALALLAAVGWRERKRLLALLRR